MSFWDFAQEKTCIGIEALFPEFFCGLISGKESDRGALKSRWESETLSSRGKSEVDQKLLKAWGLLLVSLLQFRTSSSHMKAAWKLRKSWKILAKLRDTVIADLLPDQKELLLCAIGMFHFTLGLIPHKYWFIVKLLGFEPCQETGVKELMEAYTYTAHSKESNIRGFVSLFVASILTFYFMKPDLSFELCLRVRNSTPNAAVFTFMAGYSARKMYNLHESLKLFELAHDESEVFLDFRTVCLFEMGWCHFLLGQNANAIEKFREFLNRQAQGQNNYRSWAWFHCGLAYMFQNKTSLALDCFKKVEATARPNYDFDTFVKRKANEFLLMKDIPPFESIALRAYFLTKGGLFAQTMHLLESTSEFLPPENEPFHTIPKDLTNFESEEARNSLFTERSYVALVWLKFFLALLRQIPLHLEEVDDELAGQMVQLDGLVGMFNGENDGEVADANSLSTGMPVEDDEITSIPSWMPLHGKEHLDSEIGVSSVPSFEAMEDGKQPSDTCPPVKSFVKGRNIMMSTFDFDLIDPYGKKLLTAKDVIHSALSLAEKILTENERLTRSEKWIAPHAYYLRASIIQFRLCSCVVVGKETIRAEDTLRLIKDDIHKAMKFRDYDFHKPLGRKLKKMEDFVNVQKNRFLAKKRNREVSKRYSCCAGPLIRRIAHEMKLTLEE